MDFGANLLLGYKPPQIDSPQEAQARRLTLKNALLQNQAGELDLSTKQDAINRMNTVRDLLKGADPKDYAGIYRANGMIDEAGKLEKQQQEAAAAGVELENKKLTQAKERNQLIGQHMGFLKDNPSIENLQGTLQNLVSLGVMKPDEAQAAFESGPKDPEGIRTLATRHFQSAVSTDKQLGQIMAQDGGGYTTINQVSPVTGQVRVLARNEKTQTPDSIASIERSQNEGALNRDNQLRIASMNDARQREIANMNDLRQREATQVQRDLKGLQAQKLENELNQTKLGKQGAIDTYTTAIDTLDRLANHKGLSAVVGVPNPLEGNFGVIGALPGTEAANFKAELETFKSQVFLPMVQNLRGMGALSDAEGKKLSAAVGALDQSMSEKAFKNSIKLIRTELQRSKDRFGSMQNQSSNSVRLPTKPASAADYLKSKGL